MRRPVCASFSTRERSYCQMAWGMASSSKDARKSHSLCIGGEEDGALKLTEQNRSV